MSGRDGSRPRNLAQWVSFAVASLVLAVVVGLVVVEAAGPNEPPTPVVHVGEVREAAGRWFASVEVVNEGDLTAAEVQVEAELVVDGEPPEGGDQTLDFLAGHETRHLVFAFDHDPADGELTVVVTGFSDPH